MSFLHRLLKISIAEDEALNVALLNGDAHVTTSAHCGAQIVAKKPCWFCRTLCRVLDWFHPRHCVQAWYSEKEAYESTKNLPGGD